MVCDTLQQLAPDSAAVYEARAGVYLMEHLWQQAISTAGQAVALQPRHKSAHEIIFWASLQLRDAHLAQSEATAIAAIDPADPYNADKRRRADELAGLDGVSLSLSLLLLAACILLCFVAFRHTMAGPPHTMHWALLLLLPAIPASLGYCLFQYMAPVIHMGNIRYLPQEFNPATVRDFTFDHDGREGFVLYALFTIVMGLSVGLYLTADRIRRSRYLWLLTGWGGMAILLWCVGIYVPYASWPVSVSGAVLLAAGMVVAGGLLSGFVYRSRALSALAVIVLAALPLIRCDRISVYDYGYILAPALRLYHHVPVREIYFQYDLYLSYMALALLRMGIDLSYFAEVGQMGYSIFFIALYLLARSWFKDHRLPLVLLLFAVLFRFYANYEPVGQFQITPWRLDLWLLLLILAYRYGLYHWSVALALGALIVFHRNFGLLYLAAYVQAALCYAVYALSTAGADVERSAWLRSMVPGWLWVAVILCGSFGVVYVISGTLMPESALLYSRVGVGMLPVSPHTIYWYMPVVLGGIVLMLLSYRSLLPVRYITTGLLLVFITLAESMYFFGRSHEHNIINLAGPVSLCLFLLLDLIGVAVAARSAATATHRGKYLHLLAPLFMIAILSFSYYHTVTTKLKVQYTALRSGQLHDPMALDFDFEKLRSDVHYSPKVVFLSFDRDWLYCYRGGYVPEGYYCPIDAWLLRKDLVAMLQSHLDQGYYIAVTDPACVDEIIARLHYRYRVDRGRYYILSQKR